MSLEIIERKQYIISILPSDARLIDFLYNSKCFGNMVVKITQKGKLHTFITDRGEIYYNDKLLYNPFDQHKEKEDTFLNLIQVINNTLDK